MNVWVVIGDQHYPMGVFATLELAKAFVLTLHPGIAVVFNEEDMLNINVVDPKDENGFTLEEIVCCPLQD